MFLFLYDLGGRGGRTAQGAQNSLDPPETLHLPAARLLSRDHSGSRLLKDL